jgi:hypothetical protein
LRPGQDPVVVRAEQTTVIAFEFVDAFLKWERSNEMTVGGEVHSFAETVRRNAPLWFTHARTLTKAYKSNRTPENKANLLTALAVLEAAMGEAQKHITYGGPQ